MGELLTSKMKIMNKAVCIVIHFLYLMVADYFTEITCLRLQMKSVLDHPLSLRQIKFQTLLL